VDVCLTCFNGGCNDPDDALHRHSLLHYEKTGHPIILNIKRTPKFRPEEEPPKKLTKLEIVAEEPESERFDFHTSVYCRICSTAISKDAGNVLSMVML
jgi:ubiquitin carboxyl-terminal hydrolase 5/13